MQACQIIIDSVSSGSRADILYVGDNNLLYFAMNANASIQQDERDSYFKKLEDLDQRLKNLRNKPFLNRPVITDQNTHASGWHVNKKRVWQAIEEGVDKGDLPWHLANPGQEEGDFRYYRDIYRAYSAWYTMCEQFDPPIRIVKDKPAQALNRSEEVVKSKTTVKEVATGIAGLAISIPLGLLGIFAGFLIADFLQSIILGVMAVVIVLGIFFWLAGAILHTRYIL